MQLTEVTNIQLTEVIHTIEVVYIQLTELTRIQLTALIHIQLR